MEGVELYSIFSGLVPCIGCILFLTCYNTYMENNNTTIEYDSIHLVRVRERTVTKDNRFVFQTVWNFSADGINEEVYIVSAVVSIDSESVCETFIFPARDDQGNDFNACEVFSSPDFKGKTHDHKYMLGEYLKRCDNEQREESRFNAENFENLFCTS